MGARHTVSAPTHNVTHISKSSGGHSGNDRIIFSSKPVQTVPLGHKSTLALCAAHLHTHEATGSSPVVSTKTRKQYRCQRLKALCINCLRAFALQNLKNVRQMPISLFDKLR